MTNKYNNVYVSDSYTIAGIYEGNGPLKKYFSRIYDKDLYYGEDTFEKAESRMLSDSIIPLISKNNNIDLIISGDLQNQISSSNSSIITPSHLFHFRFDDIAFSLKKTQISFQE